MTLPARVNLCAVHDAAPAGYELTAAAETYLVGLGAVKVAWG